MTISDLHAERRTGLGGSDLGAILGLNPYRTPFQVWQEKTGRTEPFDGNLQTRFGTHAEQFVADEYTRTTGRQVQRYNTMLRHPEAPLIGHVDRLVIPEGAKIAAHRREIRTDRLLECKTAHALAAARTDEWGEAGTDLIPPSYLAQCACYQLLTGCAHADLAVLFGNSDFRVYHITRDPELESMIIEEAARWWRDYVETDTPPDPSSEAEARQRWAAHQPGKVLDVDADTADLLREYAALKAREKAIGAELQSLRDRFIPALADADVVTYRGATLATYRANKPGMRTNWAGLAQALMGEFDLDEPARIAWQNDYTETQPGARVLRLTKEITA